MTDLHIVLEAARKWANELTEYIAPDAEQRGADQEVDDYQEQADRISAAITALEKGVEPPTPTVSYAPCMTGTIEAGGAVSEFLLPLDRDDVGFSQWGAPNEILWQRVGLLDTLSGSAKEWWAENKPEEGEDDE